MEKKNKQTNMPLFFFFLPFLKVLSPNISLLPAFLSIQTKYKISYFREVPVKQDLIYIFKPTPVYIAKNRHFFFAQKLKIDIMNSNAPIMPCEDHT